MLTQAAIPVALRDTLVSGAFVSLRTVSTPQVTGLALRVLVVVPEFFRQLGDDVFDVISVNRQDVFIFFFVVVVVFVVVGALADGIASGGAGVSVSSRAD